MTNYNKDHIRCLYTDTKWPIMSGPLGRWESTCEYLLVGRLLNLRSRALGPNNLPWFPRNFKPHKKNWHFSNAHNLNENRCFLFSCSHVKVENKSSPQNCKVIGNFETIIFIRYLLQVKDCSRFKTTEIRFKLTF